MRTMFITVTGLKHYLGTRPFRVGRIVRLCKEPRNEYDEEAIRVELPYIDTIGYVANSASTVYEGTFSAGFIGDEIEDVAYAEVEFITHSAVIAAVIPPDVLEEIRQSTPERIPELPHKDGFEAPTEKERFKIRF